MDRQFVFDSQVLERNVKGRGYEVSPTRGSKPTLSAALVFLLAAGLLPREAAARFSLSDLFRRRKQKKAAQVRVEKKLRAIKRKQQTVADELRTTKVALHRAETALQRVTRQLKETEAQLKKTEQALTATQRKLAKHNEVLGSRLRAIYKNGSVGYLEVVLAADDFSDFVRSAYFFRKIVERDTNLLEDIKAEKAVIAEKKAKLKAQRDRQRALRARRAVQTAAVQREKTRRQSALARLARERRLYEQQRDEILAESRRIEAELRRLQRTQQGRPTVKPWRGSFIRPVNGRLTSRFGYRVHPIYHIRKLHTGIDLAAPTGTPIHAAAGGVVVSSGWRRGYGNTVIIDHGGGKATLYGHCSSLCVRANQRVNQGQVIARVGSTGNSTGPHLHFEIRIDGRPVDPLKYGR